MRSIHQPGPHTLTLHRPLHAHTEPASKASRSDAPPCASTTYFSDNTSPHVVLSVHTAPSTCGALVQCSFGNIQATTLAALLTLWKCLSTVQASSQPIMSISNVVGGAWGTMRTASTCATVRKTTVA